MNKKLIRFSALVMALIMVFSLCSCGNYEDDEEEIKYASAVPTNKEEILNRFNEAMASAKKGTPAISYSLDQGAKGAECENKYVEASFKTIADRITDESFDASTEYGESTKDIFPLMGSDSVASLNLNDIRSAVITDNKSEAFYTILIKIFPESNPTNGNGVYSKVFNIEKDQDVLKNFDVIGKYLTADSYDAQYGTGTIKAVIDKTTDHITKLELHRDVAVTTTVTAHDTLQAVGSFELKFNYNSTAKYSLDWDNPATDDVIEQ